jgi:hypothetical protein
MNYTATSCGVSEDKNGVTMPLTLPFPARGEGTVSPRSTLKEIIRIQR